MAIQPLSQVNPTPAVSRLKLQADIVQANADLTLSTGNRPLELLYRSAIEKLNEHLEPELGPDAIRKAADSGMDFSPEAVAERIVSFATGFFGAYADRHAGESGEEQLDGFMQLVRGAIEQGFNEAREILDGLGVFQGEIADKANRTYGLIEEKLALFETGIRNDLAEAGG